MPANIIPNLKGYGGIERLRFWCYKILPLVYDDSLSYYEVLCKVMKYLNEVISDLHITEENVDELAKSFKELEDYVNNWFDGGEGYEYISEVVADWIEAHPEVVTTVQDGSITLPKFSEELLNTVEFGSSNFVAPLYIGDFINEETKYGCSAVAKVGNLYYCLECNFHGSTDLSNMGYIRIFDSENNVEITDGFPKEIEIGHGNSIAYDYVNEYFYIVPIYDYTGGEETPVNHIIRYNKTFTTKSYISIDISPVGFMGVSYDSKNNELFGLRYDGKIYKLGTNGFELYSTLDVSGMGGTNVGVYIQDFAVYDHMFYISSPTGRVVYGVLNEEESNVNGSFVINNIDSQNWYKIAEFQGIEFDRYGHLIIASFAYHNYITDNFIFEVPTSHSIPYGNKTDKLINYPDTVYYTQSIASKFYLDYNECRHPSCIAFMVTKPKKLVIYQSNFTSENEIQISDDIEIVINGCTLECKYIYIQNCRITISGVSDGILKLTGTGRGLLFPWISSEVKLKTPLKLNLVAPANAYGNFVMDGSGFVTFFSDIPTTDITIGNSRTIYINDNEYVPETLYYGNTVINPGE